MRQKRRNVPHDAALHRIRCERALNAPPLRVRYLAESDPGRRAAVAEAGRERAEVGDDAGRDQNVSEQVVVDGLQVGRRLIPAIFLAAEPTNQLLRSHQLLRTDCYLPHRSRASRYRDLKLTILASGSRFYRRREPDETRFASALSIETVGLVCPSHLESWA